MSTVVVAGKPVVLIKETEIKWAPVSQSVRVSFEGTDQKTVSTALKNTFGNFPIRVSNDDVVVLRAMGNAAGLGSTPYNEIADALEKFGELELTEA